MKAHGLRVWVAGSGLRGLGAPAVCQVVCCPRGANGVASYRSFNSHARGAAARRAPCARHRGPRLGCQSEPVLAERHYRGHEVFAVMGAPEWEGHYFEKRIDSKG